ncbi:ribonuclease H family protein [Mycobacterium sp. DL440]|uniref:ribonuclease H family protein n=1 Tax=Mycobacterium sp. DL440 TaxID=2675523 RepID=UPI001AAF6418|nr:ribonuclease H family protein [Mycobacterium sp. DL440]
MPQARPRRIDLVYAHPRPAESIAIAVSEMAFGYRYAAVGESWSCSGVAAAPTPEVAVLDAIDALRAGRPGSERIRFVVNLTSGSPLWRYAGQISDAAGDWWIERPDHADQSLLEAAAARAQKAGSGQPGPPSPRAIYGGPVTVATDGSVRQRHAGFGWLASSGDYGVAGYRSSSRRVGTQPVLVAELRAIGAAVSALPRHHLTVLSDSRLAIAMVNRWKRGEPAMPADYPAEIPDRDHCLHAARRRIYLERSRFELRWVPGHSGDPLNEGADALARLGSRYRRGDADLDDDEYHRRAAGIAQAFAAEFRRAASVSA